LTVRVVPTRWGFHGECVVAYKIILCEVSFFVFPPDDRPGFPISPLGIPAQLAFFFWFFPITVSGVWLIMYRWDTHTSFSNPLITSFYLFAPTSFFSGNYVFPELA